MSRKNISSGSYLEKPIGFSRAVRMGNIISISGTAPITNDVQSCPDDLYNQAKICLRIIQKAIEEAGGKMEEVIRTRLYLKNVNNWKEAARAHGEIFSEIKPACTFVGVQGFIDPEWLIEIEAECVINPDV